MKGVIKFVGLICVKFIVLVYKGNVRRIEAGSGINWDWEMNVCNKKLFGFGLQKNAVSGIFNFDDSWESSDQVSFRISIYSIDRLLVCRNICLLKEKIWKIN